MKAQGKQALHLYQTPFFSKLKEDFSQPHLHLKYKYILAGLVSTRRSQAQHHRWERTCIYKTAFWNLFLAPVIQTINHPCFRTLGWGLWWDFPALITSHWRIPVFHYHGSAISFLSPCPCSIPAGIPNPRGEKWTGILFLPHFHFQEQETSAQAP